MSEYMLHMGRGLQRYFKVCNVISKGNYVTNYCLCHVLRVITVSSDKSTT